MYREALPTVVRNHIAKHKFNKDTYKEIFELSDQVFDSNQESEPKVAAIQVATASSSSSQSQSEVAAVAYQKKPRRNRGGQNGGQNQGKPATAAQTTPPATQPSTTGHKGPRHATAKGSNDKLCKIHYKWGINGNYCVAPWQCPMKDVHKAPQ